MRFPTAVDGKVLVDRDAGDDTIDSDAAQGDGTTGPIALEIAQRVEDVDAGLEDPRTASVGDTVSFDAGGDGILGVGEAGAEGVAVKLLDAGGAVVGRTTTGGDGTYLFTGLAAGTYAVMFLALPGSGFTTEGTAADDAVNGDSDADVLSGMTDTFVLSIGEAERDIDAGLVALNGDPTANDGAVKTCADEEAVVDVLLNHNDPDMDALSITAVDGQAIAEGGTAVTAAGTIVRLENELLVLDGEAACVGLDIGEEAVERIGYVVSDGNGGSAWATLTATFCGDANSVGSMIDSLPDDVTYQLAYGLDNEPIGEFAFDVRLSGTGDARLDGLVIGQAYCLSAIDDALSAGTFADAPFLTADLFVPEEVSDGSISDKPQTSFFNGNDAQDDLDLVQGIVAQRFEDDDRFNGWEVQFAI